MDRMTQGPFGDETRTIEKTVRRDPQSSFIELLRIFLRLGLTSFGGPVAHLGYFREEFVARRKWFTEAAYADLVALCQFLPGPASSQVGFGIGVSCGGPQKLDNVLSSGSQPERSFT